MADPTLTEEPTPDGRELRSRRTRFAIVESWLDLVEGGNTSPTAREIADRAGIGLRTVFQHFGDMDELHSSAAAVHLERVAPFLACIRRGRSVSGSSCSARIGNDSSRESLPSVERPCIGR